MAASTWLPQTVWAALPGRTLRPSAALEFHHTLPERDDQGRPRIWGAAALGRAAHIWVSLPAMLLDVQRAIRFIRAHASEWSADTKRIALVGGSAGGYLSNIVGLLDSPGDKAAKDPVERERSRVQAVVTLFGPSDFRGKPMNTNVEALLGAPIKEKSQDAVLADASPITHVSRRAPPFLLIHGDKDEAVPYSESTNLQDALRAAGVRCDLIRIPNGPHATGAWYKVPGVPVVDAFRTLNFRGLPAAGGPPTLWLRGLAAHDCWLRS
jgi:acetyl esterase/lipase